MNEETDLREENAELRRKLSERDAEIFVMKAIFERLKAAVDELKRKTDDAAG